MDEQITVKPLANRWRLWVDGCGGFLILSGDRWTVGGPTGRLGGLSSNGEKTKTDICVATDWPSHAGTLSRSEDCFFWQAWSQGQKTDRIAVSSGRSLPIDGAAEMNLVQPSPLSPTGVLTLRPPHRFTGHVDAVILAEQALLVGSTNDCHARGHWMAETDKVVMTRRDDVWMAKSVADRELRVLPLGERAKFGSIAMMLERATFEDE
ncbi:hypothetical protein [Novipirellula artificiosorum]|uniref:Uncharacterized protein n=1 Tax=Novipirellula artificiosorum TaxID=2528016 RepID=A0A5C6DDT5_9BACT|nr:hypothetical protein [Novipirellula artificiosorum]TWU34345.1 hypothetical protein Poly41_44920 [Novipirellula artificiosorum]